MVKNPAAMWEIGVQSLGWEDPLEKRKAIYFSILAWGNPMARGAWRATVYGATKSQTRLSKKHFHTNSTESHLVLFFIFSARFFFFKIFLCGPFLKSLPNLVQYCSHCTFWFFGPEACGTLVPRPAIKPDLLHCRQILYCLSQETLSPPPDWTLKAFIRTFLESRSGALSLKSTVPTLPLFLL